MTQGGEAEAARQASLERRVAQAVLKRAGGGLAAAGCLTSAGTESPSATPSRTRTWHLWPAPSQAWRGRQGGAQFAAPIKTNKEESLRRSSVICAPQPPVR